MPRNAGVDDVHNPADGRRSEQERRRTAQYLDPFGGEWVDSDGMIGAGRGKVQRTDAVREDPDAIAGKSAKHRRGRLRAEAGGCHARLAGERLPNAWTDFAGQLGLVEDRDAAKNVSLPAFHAGDNDGLALVAVRILRAARGWSFGTGRGHGGAALRAAGIECHRLSGGRKVNSRKRSGECKSGGEHGS